MVVAIALFVGIGSAQVDASVLYVYPIAGNVTSTFSATHFGYPATDIFANCGAAVLAPVSGLVSGLRRTDLWTKKSDNPWFRGGKFVSIAGRDGVRYYLAHLGVISGGLAIGSVVQVGQRLGTVGRTGRAGACHLHFGISPPCSNSEWWVRRGVIWPAKYLQAWRAGVGKSPVDEILRWLHNNPGACVDQGQLR
ncbi:MAG: M23 family metallopeptidase [Ilumatobacteraceae bacterium]